MGGGSYSLAERSTRSISKGYTTKSSQEIFRQKNINNAMNPFGVKVRESKDSKEHPNSLAIILALDVTGSMGSIPHHLIKEGLPNIMGSIIEGGNPDPQLLFLGIGDHECDTSPLQVGQFESNDELLDKWLTTVYLEGGGGGNDGESYLLAWYFAAYHTSIDCFEKHNKKGFLFTIGDEPTLKVLPKNTLKTLMGNGQYENFSYDKLLKKAQEKYNVYHLHLKETGSGCRPAVMNEWKQLMNDNCIIINSHTDVSTVISEIVNKHDNEISNINEEIKNKTNSSTETEIIL